MARPRTRSEQIAHGLRGYIRQPAKRVALRARLLRPWRVRQFHSFGRNSVIHKPIWIFGAQQVAIGDMVLILNGAWISVEETAWDLPAPVVRLGDNVGLRPHCTISASAGIVLEDGVIISSFTTLVDSDHVHEAQAANVIYNPMVSAPIHIGKGTWVGERCAILRGARIGKHCTIGANSVVNGEIPDYSVAVGAPARVVGTTRPAQDAFSS